MPDRTDGLTRMNPVLAEILATGQVKTPHGSTVPLNYNVSADEGAALQRLIRAFRHTATDLFPRSLLLFGMLLDSRRGAKCMKQAANRRTTLRIQMHADCGVLLANCASFVFQQRSRQVSHFGVFN
jgi:hypothetical protein